MTKFHFRLQSVLTLREAERQRHRVSLAQAYQADAIVQEQAEIIAVQLDDLRRRVRVATGPGVVNVERLADANRYELVLREKKQLLAEQRRRLADEIARRRQALVAVDQQVKTLEKLRERQWQQHLEMEQKRETRALDEIAQTRHRGVAP